MSVVMRWLDRLDVWGKQVDARYEAWMERHIEPIVQWLTDRAVVIIGVGVLLLLLFRFTQ